MKRFLRRLALAIVAPVILLAVVESALRVFNLGYPTGFLVPRTISGESVWVDNAFFGYRFFSPRQTRTAAPIVLTRQKNPGVFRIFVLGESAAMGEPQPAFGLARWLEVMLREQHPDRKFEVVNAAMTAINSHVITEIVRDLAPFEPDLFVVYMGNNEVVGPFGPGSVLNPIRVRASRLRLAGLLRAAVARWTPDDGSERWSGMEMFTGRRVRADDPRLRLVYHDFQSNLERILDTAHGAGAAVILSTVAVNLRDCAPFAGDDAREEFTRGNFTSARELDELRFRADSTINAIIRDAAARYSKDVSLVDAEARFDPAGRFFFVDHVHLTTHGNYTLAALILNSYFPKANIPPIEACLSQMSYTDWNRLDLVESLIMRRERAPFAGQPGNLEQLEELRRESASLAAALSKSDVSGLRARYESDPHCASAWSEILISRGEFVDSESVLRREMERLPHRFDVRSGLALALAYQHRLDEAENVFADLPRPRGHFPADLLVGVSRTLARDGRNDAALRLAQAAQRLAPRAADLEREVAVRLASLGRRDEAEAIFREQVRKNPGDATSRDELAALLVLNHRGEEALEILGDRDDETRLKRAQIFMVMGRLDEADALLRKLEAAHGNWYELTLQRAKLSQLLAKEQGAGRE